MLLEFDAQGLEKAISSFHDAMGVSISILYEDYSVLGSKKLNNPYCRLVQSNKKGLTRCMDSNCSLLEKCKNSKKTEIRICHAGLVEVATPILYGDEVIGYVSFGHIKYLDKETDLSEFISDLPVESAVAEELYRGASRRGIASASLGGVQVQYRQGDREEEGRRLYRAAGVYLDIYRGRCADESH